jgi:hypothetical protein
MKPPLKEAFAFKLSAARGALARGELDAAFRHLERAHVLGQRHTGAHVLVHRGMLRVGWLRRDAREVSGQLLRIAAALIFSRIWVPVGNTGGANVSAFQAMPVPDDLRRWLGE